MSGCDQSAETTLAVILGAADWPKCPGLPKLPQAETAARNIKNYLCGNAGLNIPDKNVKNLFDYPGPASSMLEDARTFLKTRNDEINRDLGRFATDVFIYFAGHGDVVVQNNEYYLFVRSTDATLLTTTALSIKNMAEVIRDTLSAMRCYIILDACHSGAAVRGFSNPQMFRSSEKKTDQGFPGRGVSLLCSSSSGQTSKAKADSAYPMFTEALLEALMKGDAQRSMRLSLRDIQALLTNLLKNKHDESMVWPEIHSPYQYPGGEVADFPLFPNSAAKQVSAPDLAKWDIDNKKEEVFEDNPYLLETTFAAREECLRDLTDWATNDETRVLCICDLGGTGKTALVCKWFTSEGTKEMLAEQGYSKFWATFYAKDYDWLKFLRHLAFRLNVQLRELDGFAGLNTADGQRSLQEAILRRLRVEKWFIILDGLEREMGAFATPGNEHYDSEQQDLRNENNDIPFEERYIRSLVFGDFLRALRGTLAKVIITSRLFPEDLRSDDRNQAVVEYPFAPMSPEDAIRVWNSVPGAMDRIVDESEDEELRGKFFKAIGYHPQVIVIVASAVEESKELPGLRNWFNQFPDEQTNCLDGSLKTTLRHRWVELATRDIVSDRDKKKCWILLCRIATQSDASDVEALVNSTPRLFSSGYKLKEALRYLRKRRLLGYDEARQQVDVHPVIRTHITKYILAQVEKTRAGGEADHEVLQHLADSGSAGEIYQKFMSQSNLEEALQAIDTTEPLISEVGYKYFLVRILASIYPNPIKHASPWLESLPALKHRKSQALWLHRTGSALMASGQWDESVVLFRRAQLAYRLCGDTESVEECARSQDWQRIYCGSLRASETRLLDALEKRVHTSLVDSDFYWLALLLAIRRAPSAQKVLEKLPSDSDRWAMQTVAEAWYYLGEYDKAKTLAADSLKRKERTSTGQLLWEVLTLGLSRLRLGEITESGDNLHVAAVGGQGHYYPIITMFAYAGYIEHLYLTGINAALQSPVRKQEKLVEALRIYSRYTQCDSRNQYQIPAAEAHLAAAKVELELGNRDKALQLAEVALQVARGLDPPFCYYAGESRALTFLDSLQKPCPPRPAVDLVAVSEHEKRVSQLFEKWERRSHAGT